MEFSCTAGEGKHRVEFRVQGTGDGLVVTVFGGERPHVGAVCLGLPRPSLKDPGVTSCDTAVLPVPGHKDDEIAKPVAEAIAKATGQTAVVIAGLHIDNASEADIALLVENTRKGLERLLEDLGRVG